MSANILNVTNLIRYQFQIAQLSVNLMQKYQLNYNKQSHHTRLHIEARKSFKEFLYSIDIKGCSFHCCELSL